MAIEPDDTDYPSTDGKPMAESDLHRDIMSAAIETVHGWFAGRPDVYVTGNLMVFLARGDPRRYTSPDLMVVFGVPPGSREFFKTWEEGHPSFVLEITSKKTRRKDFGSKMTLYRDAWRVPEYFLFDPREEYLRPSLQGLRLVNGAYVPIPAVNGRITADTVGLTLERAATGLVFRAAATGRRVERPGVGAVRRAVANARHSESEIRRIRAQTRLAVAQTRRLGFEARQEEAKIQLIEAKTREMEAACVCLRAQLPPGGVA